MRIVQITPGSGGTFYCENCLRDNTLVTALRAAGHDVSLVPLYLPLLDGPELADAEAIFFGGVNVYLQQKLALFRHTPRWVDRWLDAPKLLKWAASRAGMTTPADLGEMTLSMLRGERGRQVKELDRLVDFLAERDRPDVISLSNALLVGLARRIRDRLDVPVLCALQDEDGFLDSLGDPFRQEAWRILIERAGDVDAFLPVSEYYATVMAQRLAVSRDRMHVIPCGVAPSPPADRSPDPPVIGFLSQLCEPKGPDLLAEAFILLKRQGDLANVRLRFAGGQTAAAEAFIQAVRDRLGEAGASDDVEFVGNLDKAGREAFLRTLTVLSVPTRRPEAFGLFVLESLAAGVPVVQPAHGAFVELIESTGGGLLCDPCDPEALAEALGKLLRDPGGARRMGQRGREAVLREFSMEKIAADFARVCEQVTGTPRGTQ